jgi:hypothetical protein
MAKVIVFGKEEEEIVRLRLAQGSAGVKVDAVDKHGTTFRTLLVIGTDGVHRCSSAEVPGLLFDQHGRIVVKNP